MHRDDIAQLTDTELALRLVQHLRDIQAEDGCDIVGQESNDLMWAVARRFGLRAKKVDHGPQADCPFTGPHAFAECGGDMVPLIFEKA